MKKFDKVLEDLKSLKIQGAENVAEESVKALYNVLLHSKAHTAHDLLREIDTAKNKLIKTRPTEPCMRNALKYVIAGIKHEEDLVEMSKKLDQRIKEAQEHFHETERKIALIGSRKIRKGMVVFTHCHSSTVMDILKHAKLQGKVSFEAHNTETRPLFQGRITAEELAGEGIKVNHYVDSAARLALKKADICLFGADAIQSDGTIINKIGTELFVEIANLYEVPVYFCTDSWKFDPKSVYGIDEPIENRNKKEVWNKTNKNIIINNPAFEIIDPVKASGIISELGIFRPGVFVEEVRRQYPWLV